MVFGQMPEIEEVSDDDDEPQVNTKWRNNTSRDVAPACIPLPQKTSSSDLEVAVVNARSVMNKIDDVGTQIKVGQIDVMLLSETWETPDASMGGLIEALEQTYSLQWYGRGRATRKGGGVAVVVNNSFGTARQLDICVQGVEIIWVEITPYYDPNLRIIAAAFYSSSSKEFQPEKEALQDHVLDTIEVLNQSHPRIEYLIGGDLNSDTLSDLEHVATIKQLVSKPTRNGRLLDRLYSGLEMTTCVINPPLAVCTENGADSDHDIPVVGLKLPSRPTKRWLQIKRQIYTR